MDGRRIGFGMQLAGPSVGPPRDPGSVAPHRKAVAAGVNHIDTADYGPRHQQIIRGPCTTPRDWRSSQAGPAATGQVVAAGHLA